MIIKGNTENFEVVISKDNPDAPNVIIEGDIKNGVRLTLNAYKIYNTMALLTPMAVALDSKVKDLIQKHLVKQAGKELEVNDNEGGG